MRKRSQRLWLIGAAAVLATGATALAVTALSDTVAYFYAPSDLAASGAIEAGKSVRIGGLIEEGSMSHNAAGDVIFRITDGVAAIPVGYSGIMPDLAVEGQGVVAEGRFDATGQLVAKRVLARHDENYMPKEVYEALKDKAGAAESGGYPAPGPST